jgi:effector-binding domain-containing protein
MWKKIVFGLLAIVIVLVMVGFLLPEQVEVSRSITVNAPAEYSYEEINKLENWKNWSYWNTLDPAMQVTFGDKRMGAGAFYAWASSNMGNGKLTITESVPFESIKADLNFMEQGTAKSWYTFQPEGENTKVTMNILTHMGMNPIMRWMGVTMFKIEMNKAFDYSLTKIKELAEAKPKFTIAISEEEVQPMSYVGLSHTMSSQNPRDISEQMGKMYSELMKVLQKANIPLKGHPFCIYPSYNEESIEMICALPVDQNVKLPAAYKIQRLDKVKAVKGIHVGNYSSLETSHNQLMKYLEFKNRDLIGAPWEVYITDPSAEPDPSKWITEIYYPINN